MDTSDGLICLSRRKGEYHVSKTTSAIMSSPSLESSTTEIEMNLRRQGSFLNKLTLNFLDTDMEAQYARLKDEMFKSNIICCLILWVLALGTQLLVLQL